MTEMVKCPVEGCDYGPQPKRSVLGHYSGKSDGRHPGGYQKAKSLLEPGSETGPEPKPEPDPEPSSEPGQPSGSAEAGSGENPVFGSAEPTTDPEPADRRQARQSRRQQQQSKQVSESGEEPVCIRCGGELWDFRNFETGRYHSVNGTRVWVRGDYQCDSCGMWLQEDDE